MQQARMLVIHRIQYIQGQHQARVQLLCNSTKSLPASGHVENPASITINASGPATPYPSVITVSGLPSTGVGVKCSINRC
ncbi:MAG: hypothetical protein R2765_05985 [Ferruginibacter sp.]